MDFSLLFCGFVFGVIGVYIFRQGKKRSNFLTMGIAIALMVYPYFVENLILAWLVGILLCVVAYFSR